jgi:hypothetical protein
LIALPQHLSPQIPQSPKKIKTKNVGYLFIFTYTGMNLTSTTKQYSNKTQNKKKHNQIQANQQYKQTISTSLSGGRLQR